MSKHASGVKVPLLFVPNVTLPVGGGLDLEPLTVATQTDEPPTRTGLGAQTMPTLDEIRAGSGTGENCVGVV